MAVPAARVRVARRDDGGPVLARLEPLSDRALTRACRARSCRCGHRVGNARFSRLRAPGKAEERWFSCNRHALVRRGRAHISGVLLDLVGTGGRTVVGRGRRRRQPGAAGEPRCRDQALGRPSSWYLVAVGAGDLCRDIRAGGLRGLCPERVDSALSLAGRGSARSPCSCRGLNDGACPVHFALRAGKGACFRDCDRAVLRYLCGVRRQRLQLRARARADHPDCRPGFRGRMPAPS